ncbi:MAG: L-lactate dehydrogenase [Lawsonibacter sp.]|jgi:L-lactate dehydrogenase|nr:L-lactate dehydrogenase [Lawsonibacter sp.]
MAANFRKAAIVGCGFVGASIAFRFLQQGLFSNLVLLDANRARAEGEAMDLSDGLPYGASMEITAGDYDDIADCGLVVITAGVNQKPGETRLELIGRNTVILKSILKEVTARSFEGILLVVSNPVDVLTYMARELSGYPRQRVIGSGTVLDTARLKQLMGEELGVDSRNVHAFIVGEHGDSELAVWSGANVSGLDLDDFCRLQGKALSAGDMDRLYREVRDSANEIIRRKGATYYGIAMAVGRIAESIVKDEHAVLPISVVLEGEYGMEGVALSVPSIVGRNGLEKVLEIPLGPAEHQALGSSARQLREVVNSLELPSCQ